jgi:hypothetical protein
MTTKHPKIQALLPESTRNRLMLVKNKSDAFRQAVRDFHEGKYKLPPPVMKEEIKATSFSVSEEEIKMVNDLAQAHNMSAYEVIRYMLDTTLPQLEVQDV